MPVEIIEIEQGSEEWLALRRHGGPGGIPLIGSSDVPVLMGISPWKTPYRWWQEHTGRVEQEPPNQAMQQGTAREPIARMRAEMKLGRAFPPTVLLDREAGLIASLDGRSGGAHLELKCPGAKDHQHAADGLVPRKYLAQLAHQMYLGHRLGDDRSYYFSLGADDSDHLVEIEAEELSGYWVDMVPAIEQMQNWLRTDTEPPLDEKDRLTVEDDELEFLAVCLRDVGSKLAPISKEYDRLEKLLKDRATAIHARTVIGDVLVTKFPREGAVDYATAYEDAITEVRRLAEIMGEPYTEPVLKRKPSTYATKVTLR